MLFRFRLQLMPSGLLTSRFNSRSTVLVNAIEYLIHSSELYCVLGIMVCLRYSLVSHVGYSFAPVLLIF